MKGIVLVSGRPGTTTGNAVRFALRSLVVVGLSLGLAGASNLSADVDGGQRVGALEQVEAYQIEMMRTQRLVDASERADRARRTEAAEGERGTSRAVEAQEKPAPEPPPAAEAESAPSAPAPSTAVGPVPSSCGEYSGNRASGCALLLDAGFSIGQMSCLDNLWTKESGWNHRAQNPSSGAYGIPQSLPAGKMASHGSDWRTNPATQISWGLSYISNRYGSPCGAWSFWQSNNWY